jgi:hypothetical protein
MKTLRVLFLCSAALLLSLVQSSAQLLLNYEQPATPDLFSANLDVSYDYTSMQFLASGQESAYIALGADPNDPDSYTPVFGSFTLTATIDHAGNLISGTLAAMGDSTWAQDPITGAPIDDSTLLSGNLVAGPKGNGYDYTPGGLTFAFLFTVTGGDYMADFGGQGATGYISLDPWWPDGYWDGSFGGNLQNPGSPGTGYSGAADTVSYIPEPSSALLFLIGGIVWSAARRRRR